MVGHGQVPTLNELADRLLLSRSDGGVLDNRRCDALYASFPMGTCRFVAAGFNFDVNAYVRDTPLEVLIDELKAGLSQHVELPVGGLAIDAIELIGNLKRLIPPDI